MGLIMKIFNNTVFIHVDSLRRDKSISCLIKNVLEKIGYNVFLTSRRNLRLIEILKLRPSSIILSHVGGNFSKNELYEISKKSKLFLLMPEGFASDAALGLDFPIDFDYDVFSAIFVWGNYEKNWLIKNRDISKDKVIVAGFHRFDLYGLHDNFLDNVTSASTKKRVGFIGRFDYIDVFDKRSLSTLIIQSIGAIYDARDLIHDQVKSFSLYLKIFDCIYNDTDYLMSYRPHPNERVDYKELIKSRYKDRFSFSIEEDFNSWVLSQDVIISPTSSSYVEAYLLEKPIISINRIINARKWDPAVDIVSEAFDEYAYTPSTFEELIELLLADDLKPGESSKTRDILRDYYDWPRDNYSTVDIVKTVMKHDPVKRSNILGKLLIKLISIGDYALFNLRRLKDKDNVEVIYNYNSYYHKSPNYIEKLSEKIITHL